MRSRSLLSVIKRKEIIRLPVLVSFIFVLVVGLSFFGAATGAAQDCTSDLQLADDEPGQKDLNEFCEGAGTSPFELEVTFNFDDTRWAGSNTGDACALFDTDADNFANFALCVTVVDGDGQPAYQSPLSPRLYQCANDRVDRCTDSIELVTFSSVCSVNEGGSEPSGEDADPFAAVPSRKCSGTDCTIEDAFVACLIEIDDVSPGEFCDGCKCFFSGTSCSSDGDCVPLTDVCSFPSEQPNSDPSDCIVTPPSGDLCLGVDCSHLDDDCNIGVCDPVTGLCVADPLPDSTPCEDGDVCTSETGTPHTADHCVSGVCTGVPVDCSGAGDQCNDGVCNTTTGACVADPKPDSTPCEDGNVCTSETGTPHTADHCVSGVCTGVPVDCSSEDDQCNDGVCDPATGDCVPDPKPDSTPCDDNLYCTVNDQCTGGVCGGAARDCDEGLYCTINERCDEGSDQCLSDPRDCSDALFCTINERCDDTVDQCLSDPKDCSDALFCTINERCDEGSDQCLSDPRDCSDALFCTINERCDDTVDQCLSDPRDCSDALFCTINERCDDTVDQCLSDPKDCSDALFCTINERCDEGSDQCLSDTRDCPPDTQCNEATDSCDPITTTTTSVLITTTTSTIPTTSTTTTIIDTECNTKIYRGGVCEESSPLDTIYNRPGRRGLAVTCCEEEEFCVCSSCDPELVTFIWTVTIIEGSDPDFTLDDLVASEGEGDTFIIKVEDPCNEHCPDEMVELEVCVEDSEGNVDCVIVTIGRVALGIGETNAHPGTQTADIDLLLWNYENHLRAIQANVSSCEKWDCEGYDNENDCTDITCGAITDETQCNDDPNCKWKTVGGVPQCVNQYNCEWTGSECLAQDNMVCTECVVDEDRSPELICIAAEQEDGSCMITLFSTEPDDLIQQGDGAVARIKYDILEEKTSKDCMCLWPYGIKISDQFNERLCACPKSGEICFMIYGDVYPQDCYECESCGDGKVDLFDILEEIDIVLGLQTASLCQLLHGNVPLGMPPYCGNPAGVNPPNCENDGVIDIFDALVIIDKALSRMNCCDYCMFSEIY